jgi:hypothetical protein
MIGKVRGPGLDNQTDTIHPKQSDQNDHPARPSRFDYRISMI